MIKDSSKKLFDMIIIWKLDCLDRNRYDNARYKETLKNSVKVAFATESISGDAAGILLEFTLGGIPKCYSAYLSVA